VNPFEIIAGIFLGSYIGATWLALIRLLWYAGSNVKQSTEYWKSKK
jgi:hypothetical protein